MPLLKLVSEVSAALPDMNDEFTWTEVNTFQLLAPATSEQYLTEMLASFPGMKAHWLGSAHGPYQPSALTVDNYPLSSLSEVESKFGQWIEGFFGPKHPTNPEPILARQIRPHLTGAELFLLTGDYDRYDKDPLTDEELTAREAEFKLLSEGQHPTLEWEAEFLGWNEVVAINRHAGTLIVVIMGSD